MLALSTPLSENFTLKELVHSNTAERDEELKREQENPPAEIIDNLRYLVEIAIQPIRTKIDYPIKINSGYRSIELNKRVGGSATSQHCMGEAADCDMLPRFLSDTRTTEVRNQIESRVKEITGKSLRRDVNENFYLFAFICINLNDLDVDQVIHEYGDGYGHPAWVHISASKRLDKRQILSVGSYTDRRYLKPSLEEALAYGT